MVPASTRHEHYANPGLNGTHPEFAVLTPAMKQPCVKPAQPLKQWDRPHNVTRKRANRRPQIVEQDLTVKSIESRPSRVIPRRRL
jgi:hypothetical protein